MLTKIKTSKLQINKTNDNLTENFKDKLLNNLIDILLNKIEMQIAQTKQLIQLGNDDFDTFTILYRLKITNFVDQKVNDAINSKKFKRSLYKNPQFQYDYFTVNFENEPKMILTLLQKEMLPLEKKFFNAIKNIQKCTDYTIKNILLHLFKKKINEDYLPMLQNSINKFVTHKHISKRNIKNFDKKMSGKSKTKANKINLIMKFNKEARKQVQFEMIGITSYNKIVKILTKHNISSYIELFEDNYATEALTALCNNFSSLCILGRFQFTLKPSEFHPIVAKLLQYNTHNISNNFHEYIQFHPKITQEVTSILKKLDLCKTKNEESFKTILNDCTEYLNLTGAKQKPLNENFIAKKFHYILTINKKYSSMGLEIEKHLHLSEMSAFKNHIKILTEKFLHVIIIVTHGEMPFPGFYQFSKAHTQLRNVLLQFALLCDSMKIILPKSFNNHNHPYLMPFCKIFEEKQKLSKQNNNLTNNKDQNFNTSKNGNNIMEDNYNKIIHDKLLLINNIFIEFWEKYENNFTKLLTLTIKTKEIKANYKSNKEYKIFQDIQSETLKNFEYIETKAEKIYNEFKVMNFNLKEYNKNKENCNNNINSKILKNESETTNKIQNNIKQNKLTTNNDLIKTNSNRKKAWALKAEDTQKKEQLNINQAQNQPTSKILTKITKTTNSTKAPNTINNEKLHSFSNNKNNFIFSKKNKHSVPADENILEHIKTKEDVLDEIILKNMPDNSKNLLKDILLEKYNIKNIKMQDLLDITKATGGTFIKPKANHKNTTVRITWNKQDKIIERNIEDFDCLIKAFEIYEKMNTNEQNGKENSQSQNKHESKIKQKQKLVDNKKSKSTFTYHSSIDSLKHYNIKQFQSAMIKRFGYELNVIVGEEIQNIMKNHRPSFKQKYTLQ